MERETMVLLLLLQLVQLESRVSHTERVIRLSFRALRKTQFLASAPPAPTLLILMLCSYCGCHFLSFLLSLYPYARIHKRQTYTGRFLVFRIIPHIPLEVRATASGISDEQVFSKSFS